MTQGHEIGLSILSSSTVGVFVESNIQYPVKAVFDTPMSADSMSKGIYICQASEEVTVIDSYFPLYLACTPVLAPRDVHSPVHLPV